MLHEKAGLNGMRRDDFWPLATQVVFACSYQLRGNKNIGAHFKKSWTTHSLIYCGGAQ
jgi:hypothetical protein